MVRSDANHLCLQRVNATLSLLSKHQYHTDMSADGADVITISEELLNVQEVLRDDSSIDMQVIINPFLRLLRADYFSAPFKMSALEALQLFISAQCLKLDSILLADIVDAVIQCKFIQTDSLIDEVVQLSIIETLYRVILGPFRINLSDEALWKIIEKSYHMVIHLTASGSYSSLSQSSQKVLYYTTSSLLQLCDEVSLSGLPCIIKCMSFFLAVVDNYVCGPARTAFPHSRTNSSQSLIASSYDDKLPSDDSDFESFVAVKAIHCLLLGSGDFNITRKVFSNCSALSSICSDDLAKCLLLFCTSKPSVSVFVTVLPLIQTLVQVFLPVQKVLVECFMMHVYLKTLHQLKVLLQGDAESRSTADLPADAPSAGLDPECVGIVISSLTDLMSDPAFIPAIYMSFDCDPSKPDIVTPLVDLLCHTSHFSLNGMSTQNQALADLSAMSLRCLFKFIGTLNKRIDSIDGDDSKSEVGRSFSHHFRISKQAKAILAEGCKLFEVKPSKGVGFLQDRGVLERPLSSHAAARFLRVCTSLPKDIVGSFLGELGKDSPTHEVDEKQMHADILLSYVRSFEFNGQPLLYCMRIFLSAFRLPGEAQQIDRILVAFSEHCHSFCIEGESGLLENPMVTYLLTFSIIMLQTDRHNPNIREDRKMTLAQFIRNNTNYGADINQTKPLPREFLEHIFYDISEHPIRTESHDYAAVLRLETWHELQLSVTANRDLAFMATPGYSPEQLSVVSLYDGFYSADQISLKYNLLKTAEQSAAEFLKEHDVMASLLISKAIYCNHGIVDQDIISSVWLRLTGSGFTPFIPLAYLHRPQIYQGPSTSVLRAGIDILLFTIKAGHSMNNRAIVDSVLFSLAAFAGAFDEVVVKEIVRYLDSGDLEEFSYDNIEFSHRQQLRAGVSFLDSQMKSLAARSALGTLLQIVMHSPSYLSFASWNVVWYLIGLLRDCSLLPSSTVEDKDGDFLPLVSRVDFEVALNEDLYADARELLPPPVAADKSCPSRWDDGYFGRLSTKGLNWTILQLAVQGADSSETFYASLENIKGIVRVVDIDGIVANTRFLNESSLLSFVKSVVDMSEASCAAHRPHQVHCGLHVFGIADYIFSSYYLSSPNSCAWMEMIIVETILRNRDRISVMWPLISAHYMTLATVPASPSYVTERRIVGLFRISSRILSRRNVSALILDLLQGIFGIGERPSSPVECRIALSPYAGHIASGMYRVFTNNVAFLPQLRLNQWQTLFDIAALGSRSGGFASIKSFESVAWLLHESRLRAEVPVFCITVIQPLIGNPNVPVSVSLGALQLLCQLHSRLEVLFKDEQGLTADVVSLEADAPLLWDSCWTPLLVAFRDGVDDTRQDVRMHSVFSLFSCLLDIHSSVAPCSVLMAISINVIIPVILKLSYALVEASETVLLKTSDAESTLRFDEEDTNLVIYSIRRFSKLLVKNASRLATAAAFDKFAIGIIEFDRKLTGSLNNSSRNDSGELLKTADTCTISMQNIFDGFNTYLKKEKGNLFLLEPHANKGVPPSRIQSSSIHQ